MSTGLRGLAVQNLFSEAACTAKCMESTTLQIVFVHGCKHMPPAFTRQRRTVHDVDLRKGFMSGNSQEYKYRQKL